VERINRWRQRGPDVWPQLERPSLETLRQDIRRSECYETYAAKFGEKLAKKRFKANGKGLIAARFLQLGCMDHKVINSSCLETMSLGAAGARMSPSWGHTSVGSQREPWRCRPTKPRPPVRIPKLLAE
jgi:hypothetical protein